MSENNEDRVATDWRTDSRFYRRKPGLGWVVALLAVPALLALIGWGGLTGANKDVDLTLPTVDPSASLTVPTVAAPDVNLPGLGFAPFSISRSGNGFTLGGVLPDVNVKTSLLDSLRQVMPGIGLIDDFTVSPGAKMPEFGGLGELFDAALDIPDFNLNLDGDTVTLTGTAPSEDAKAAVEAAAARSWPNVKVVNNIEVEAAGTTAPPVSQAPAPSASPAGACVSLQADITSLLRTPISFATDGFTLASNSQQLVSQIAEKVKACPGAKIAVVGFTDNTGNDGINVPLSANRAKSVADELVSDGVSGDAVTSRGAGAANPVADNGTPDGRAQNRRVEITVN